MTLLLRVRARTCVWIKLRLTKKQAAARPVCLLAVPRVVAQDRFRLGYAHQARAAAPGAPALSVPGES